MDLTERGRYTVGSMALIVIGFALGSLSRIELNAEGALSMLGGAGVALFLSARRGRDGMDNGRHGPDDVGRKEPP